MPSVKQRFSIFSLLRNALGYRAGWQRMWRSPEPKRRYDVVIIGGGGHGLGAGYYLARDHRIRNVAVIEKGWLGGGNTARNTMTIRLELRPSAERAVPRGLDGPLPRALARARLQT